MGRGGVRDFETLRAVAANSVANAPGLVLHGVMGYEGHCMGIVDRDSRARETTEAMGRLAEAVSTLRAHGHLEIVSAVGTGTYFVSAAGAADLETSRARTW